MADKDLTDIPTDSDIREKVGLLKPIFQEAYRRSLAYEGFPHAHLLMESKEKIEAIKGDGDFYEYGGAWEHRSTPGSAAAQVIGYYRWSDTMKLYMPTGIPADTDMYCAEETRTSWAASTTADDDRIDGTARENTTADLTAINDAFDKVIEQCDVWPVKALLNRLNPCAEALTDLIDRHRGEEFTDVADLFEEWDGDDADHCYEVFGQRLSPAAGYQRRILAELIRSVSEEGVAQGTAMSALHNAVAGAHASIQEAINLPDYGDVALRRFFGTVVVNRVPFLSDALAATDFGFELNSEGEEVGKSGGWVSRLMEKVFPDYANVPTVELCNEVRDSLVEVGEGELEDLFDARSSFGKDLDQVDEDWSSALTCDLIPGYVD